MRIEKIAEGWLGEDHARLIDRYRDETRPAKENCRDCFKDLLDDDHPLTLEEAEEYLSEQLMRDDSDSEEIEKMLRVMGIVREPVTVPEGEVPEDEPEYTGPEEGDPAGPWDLTDDQVRTAMTSSDFEGSMRRMKNKLAFQFDEAVGGGHKFLLSPDGNVHTWAKGQGEYGDAVGEIEMSFMDEDEDPLDLMTDLRLNSGEDTYRMYRDDGWGTGVSSSGGFCLLNTPSISPEQASSLVDILRDQGFKTIVLNGPEGKKFFSSGRDAINYLSPYAAG